jgi:hypothetical protein
VFNHGRRDRGGGQSGTGSAITTVHIQSACRIPLSCRPLAKS